MLRRLIGPEIDFDDRQRGRSGQRPRRSGADRAGGAEPGVNARDAMPGGGRLIVKVDEVELDEAAAVALAEGKPGGYARLSVSDTGTGMDETDAGEALRAVLHDEGTGQGDRARPVDRLRDREAERRVHHRPSERWPGRHVLFLLPRRRRRRAGGRDGLIPLTDVSGTSGGSRSREVSDADREASAWSARLQPSESHFMDRAAA